MRIIHSLETESRQIYTGCIGFMAPDRQAQFNVAIRTVWIDQQTGQAEYGVGGGIVWDSTVADEYEECRTKASLLTSHRPFFRLLETCLWQPEGGIFLEAYHLKRMGESAQYFGYPFEQAAACHELEVLDSRLAPEPQLVRLQLDVTGQFISQAIPLKERPSPSPVRLQLAEHPVDSSNPFLYHKTTHRQVYDSFEFDPTRVDDVLLWNERGELTETRIANLMIKLDGAWLTPPVESGLLAGTYRAWMLDQGLLEEKILTVKDLGRASEIAVINAVRKQRPAILVAS
jgi:para-aminobenzoate synthetase/4-amino-4-deoxychorismate lyase